MPITITMKQTPIKDAPIIMATPIILTETTIAMEIEPAIATDGAKEKQDDTWNNPSNIPRFSC